MKSTRPSVALIVAYGPEVRAFVHSGLANLLGQQFNVVIYTPFPDSAAFDHIRNDTLIKTLPTYSERHLLRRLRSLMREIHNQSLVKQGRKRWRHTLPRNRSYSSRIKKLDEVLASKKWIVSGVGKLERFLGRVLGTNSDWKRELHEQNICLMITASMNGERVLPLLQTAHNLHIKCLVFANSWKDVYTRPYVPVLPDILSVWSNDIMRDLVGANPHLPKQSIAVIPSLHLERFLNSQAIPDRVQFFKMVGLDPTREYICYSAASPAAVEYEEAFVQIILQAIESGTFPGNPQVLLRLNPMEDGTRFKELARVYDDLVIQKPNWEWKPTQDWCCAFTDDMDTWVATVQYSKMNVSIPSTVTTEFIVLGKPVVNICFDVVPPKSEDFSVSRFWNAEFYQEMRGDQLVKPTYSGSELILAVKAVLAEEDIPQKSCGPKSPVHEVLQLVQSMTNQL